MELNIVMPVNSLQIQPRGSKQITEMKGSRVSVPFFRLVFCYIHSGMVLIYRHECYILRFMKCFINSVFFILCQCNDFWTEFSSHLLAPWNTTWSNWDQEVKYHVCLIRSQVKLQAFSHTGAWLVCQGYYPDLLKVWHSFYNCMPFCFLV